MIYIIDINLSQIDARILARTVRRHPCAISIGLVVARSPTELAAALSKHPFTQPAPSTWPVRSLGGAGA
jgi:hypothetical protein